MTHHNSLFVGFYNLRVIIWILHFIFAIALGVYLTVDYKSIFHEYYTIDC